jgi:hypothetical protein
MNMFKPYRNREIVFPIGLLFVVLCLVMVPISMVKAAEPVGKFSQMEGIVDVMRGGAMPAILVKVGDPVFEKDIIRTKSNSSAEIIFVDGNTIKISQRSRIDINEYLVGENKSSEILKLQRGRVETIVLDKNAKRISASPKAHKFEIHTPCAVTGVRGTKWSTYQSENCATIAVHEGIVYAINPNFPDKSVEVPAGKMTRACEDSPFFQPIDIPSVPDLVIMGIPPDPGKIGQPPITDTYPGILAPRGRSIPSGCFTSDTKVLMGDQTFKEIVNLKLGDMVQTFDVESGKMVPQKVTRLFTGDQDHYYLINGKLKVTGSHPFLTSEGKWKEVHRLKVGDKIQSGVIGKSIEITSVEKKEVDQEVYNFMVAEGHNYFVSPDGIELYLVHNGKGIAVD